MHLYVQAIEVFDEQWMAWKGLQQDLISLGALDPPKPAANGSAAEPPLLLALRDLRATIATLPSSQLPSVRKECHAILQACDARS